MYFQREFGVCIKWPLGPHTTFSLHFNKYLNNKSWFIYCFICSVNHLSVHRGPWLCGPSLQIHRPQRGGSNVDLCAGDIQGSRCRCTAVTGKSPTFHLILTIVYWMFLIYLMFTGCHWLSGWRRTQGSRLLLVYKEIHRGAPTAALQRPRYQVTVQYDLIYYLKSTRTSCTLMWGQMQDGSATTWL